MTEINATYFDGRTARAREVTLRFGDDGVLRIHGDGVDLSYARRSVRVESRLANTPRCLALPDGGRCETADNEGIDRALASWGEQRFAKGLHRLESSWRLALLVVAVMGVICWLAVRHGLPAAAKRVAFAVPAAVNDRLGKEALRILDEIVFEPTGLAEERRLEIESAFRRLLEAQDDARAYRLEFRAAPRLGANALALPSGTIVITDELIALARDDREILGVLAHERGHITERHGLRTALQNSAVVVVFALATGDVSTVSSLGGALPMILLQTKFSRLFELDADAQAVRAMEAADIPPRHLADLLERLSQQSVFEDSEFLTYISTHPATAERVRAIKEGATQ